MSVRIEPNGKRFLFASHVFLTLVGFQFGVWFGSNSVSPDLFENAAVLRERDALWLEREKADAWAVERRQEKLLEDNRVEIDKLKQELTAARSDTWTVPEPLTGTFAGWARVPRNSFVDQFDVGVPWTPTTPSTENVLLLYAMKESLPPPSANVTKTKSEKQFPPFYDSVETAVSNCDTVKVVLSSNEDKKQCFAIVPQFESYQIYKWVRGKSKGNKKNTNPLKFVPRAKRGGDKNGNYDSIAVPKPLHSTEGSDYGRQLSHYLRYLPATLQKLQPVADRAAAGILPGSANNSQSLEVPTDYRSKEKNGDSVVVAMVCNFGQSEMLVNFCCAARQRGLDTVLGHVLVFATDEATVELATALGLHVFDVQTAFGDAENIQKGQFPEKAAGRFKDKTFQTMAMVKMYASHLVNAAGHDVLLQDVDVVWYQNPLPFFMANDSRTRDFDMIFQDDGARDGRYAPFFPNSGFYYARHNARTVEFHSVAVRRMDLMLAETHQLGLLTILNEEVSLRGLRVKVLGRDHVIGRLFPCGFHFNNRQDWVREMIQLQKQQKKDPQQKQQLPYVFHMSWTASKKEKREYLEQMDNWFVEDACVGKSVAQITGTTATATTSNTTLLTTQCCATQSLFRCHHPKKPSTRPCNATLVQK